MQYQHPRSHLFIAALIFGLNTFVGSLIPTSALAQADEQATYSIHFEATWDRNTPHAHPMGEDGFPASAHFSALIGAVHNEDTALWREGEPATPGIEQMAESGTTSTLRTEAENEAGVYTVIQGNAVSSSPGDSTIADVALTSEFPQITLVTMIAPSPDWFVGVSGLNLFANGHWVNVASVELHAYDAGTEEGNTYSTTNPASNPHVPISQLSDHSFGRLTFTRVFSTRPRIFIPILRN